MNNFLTQILILLTLFIGACGKDPEESAPGSPSNGPALSCNSRPKLLYKTEKMNVGFTIAASPPSLNTFISPGNTLTYLDWGTLSQNDVLNWQYQAPDFIPETRTLEIIAQGGGFQSSCKVHVLSDEYVGIKDDGQTVGLKTTVYELATPPTVFPNTSGLQPHDEGVVRNVDLNSPLSVANHLFGLTDLIGHFAFRLQGTLRIDQENDYRIKLLALTRATLVIDNQWSATSNTVAANAPYIAARLTAGKHSIKIEYIHNDVTNSSMTLKLQWATRPFLVYSTIPTDHFDRE